MYLEETKKIQRQMPDYSIEFTVDEIATANDEILDSEVLDDLRKNPRYSKFAESFDIVLNASVKYFIHLEKEKKQCGTKKNKN